MPANTPKGYPYPLGTDRLADGDDAIHALATAVDTMIGVGAAGSVSVTTPASGAGTAAVTFPVGRFASAPFVALTLVSTGATQGNGNLTATGIGTAGFTANYNRGAASTFTVHWLALSI